jgi:hypothetical protein
MRYQSNQLPREMVHFPGLSFGRFFPIAQIIFPFMQNVLRG